MRLILQYGALAAMAAAGVATATYLLLRGRRGPVDRERDRHTLISSKGRLIEGMVTDFSNGVAYYSYSWRGVDYEASQEVSSILTAIEADAGHLIGPATVKFLPGDASNSIVLSETWSGLPRYRTAYSQGE